MQRLLVRNGPSMPSVSSHAPSSLSFGIPHVPFSGCRKAECLFMSQVQQEILTSSACPAVHRHDSTLRSYAKSSRQDSDSAIIIAVSISNKQCFKSKHILQQESPNLNVIETVMSMSFSIPQVPRQFSFCTPSSSHNRSFFQGDPNARIPLKQLRVLYPQLRIFPRVPGTNVLWHTPKHPAKTHTYPTVLSITTTLSSPNFSPSHRLAIASDQKRSTTPSTSIGSICAAYQIATVQTSPSPCVCTHRTALCASPLAPNTIPFSSALLATLGSRSRSHPRVTA